MEQNSAYEADNRSAVLEIARLLWNPNANCHFQNSRLNPIHDFIQFIKITFIRTSQKWALPFRFPN